MKEYNLLIGQFDFKDGVPMPPPWSHDICPITSVQLAVSKDGVLVPSIKKGGKEYISDNFLEYNFDNVQVLSWNK